jgi:hypothetical protein
VLRGYLAAGLLDVCVFWGASVPLLMLAAGVSGESIGHLGAGVGIILVCVGSYRVIGVALLTLLERDEFLLYILVRMLYVFFVLVSGFVAPLWNPVLAFVDASVWPPHLGSVSLPGVRLHGWVATVTLHLLLGGLFFIIASIRVRRIQRGAGVSIAEERGTNSGNL